MRMLTQQNIMETKNSMNTAISRREMDEIILKFNFEMLDEMFGKKLEDDIQKNVVAATCSCLFGDCLLIMIFNAR